MTDALKRILSTPLTAKPMGHEFGTIHIAEDKFHVCTIAQGMPDRIEYARLFVAASDVVKAAIELLEEIDCLAGVEFSSALIPHEAETVWNDAVARMRSAIAKARNGE